MNIDEHIAEFHTQGYSIIKNLFDDKTLERVIQTLRVILKTRLNTLNCENASNDIDVLLKALIDIDTKYCSEVITAFRMSETWINLLADKRLVTYARKLYGDRELLIEPDTATLRIDAQQDMSRFIGWHQELTYALQSNPGMTIWVPITKVTAKMGPLRIVPNTHNKVVPIELDMSKNRITEIIRPIPDSAFTGMEIINPETEPGDGILLHGLTFHASGINYDPDHARWVIIFRFSCLDDINLANKGWKIPNDRHNVLDILTTLYPEYITYYNKGDK